MLVKEFMTTGVATVSPETSIKRALRMLADHRVTAAPVVDSAGVVVGVVSEADLIRDRLEPDPRAHLGRPVTRMPDKVDVTVADVMSRPVIHVHPEEDLVDALSRLTSARVKSLPVVDEWGRVAGMISRSDLVRLLARSDAEIEVEVADLLRETVGGSWHVEVHSGVVRLTGTDATIHDAGSAELLAGTVPGVLAVEQSQASS
jgi:CBS-domain-containing membrane protein